MISSKTSGQPTSSGWISHLFKRPRFKIARNSALCKENIVPRDRLEISVRVGHHSEVLFYMDHLEMLGNREMRKFGDVAHLPMLINRAESNECWSVEGGGNEKAVAICTKSHVSRNYMRGQGSTN